jgi:lipid A 3-O-deacylase
MLVTKSITYACGLAAAAALAAHAPAGAGPLEEARLGVMRHNICVTDCKNADKEDGVNINGDLVFATPGFLDWAFSPRPYVMASVNTAGETSYGGAGLEWRWRFADGWELQPGVGYVIHNNDDLDNPYPPSDPRRGPYQDENLLLGSEDLFRTSLGVSRDLSDDWAVQVIFEHLSHGQILGEGRNQGLDELGVRLKYRFNN